MITLFWLCKIFITLPLILPGKNTKSSLKEKPQKREQVSHKVAWTAVKQKYTKKDDRWVEKIKN